ncbi:MAG: response regulator transcription factor [Sphingobacteriales bacterium]|nr:MAG: response regulator transcription factor [Sphingobacteriales bacterium]
MVSGPFFTLKSIPVPVKMYRFLIADDYEFVRQRVKLLLKEEFKDVIIEEASSTKELTDKALGQKWDIIISDINMPGGGGLEALSVIRKTLPQQPLILFSLYDEESFADKVLKQGATAYLQKDKIPAELVKTIQSIIEDKDGY